MQTTQDLQDKILSYLRKRLFYQITSGIVNLLMVILVIWISTFIADNIFYFSEAGRWFVLIVNIVLSLYLIFRFVVSKIIENWNLIKTKNLTPLTREIGRAFPDISDKLTNIYQLSRMESDGDSGELRHQAVRRFSDRISALDFKTALILRNFLFSFSFIFLILTGSLFLVLTVPDSLLSSAIRIINPTSTNNLVPEYTFTIMPGDTSLLAGNSLKVQAKFSGPPVEKVNLIFRRQNEEYATNIEMRKTRDSYSGELINLRSSLEYRLKAIPQFKVDWQDKLVSDNYNVEVKTPPTISELQVRIIPPGYTKLPEELLDKNLGNILAYKGSQVNISAFSSKPVNSAFLIFSDDNQKTMLVNENKLTSNFSVTKSGSYHLSIMDQESINNQSPIEYQINALIDRYPTIELIDPGEDLEIPPDAAINLLIDANDDFGFSQLKLNYQVISSIPELSDSSWQSVFIKIPDHQTKYFQQTYLWNFQTQNVGYGDAINYYLSLSDNDQVSGPKWSRTKTYHIRFPTLEQLFTEFDNRQEKNLDETRDISEESKAIKEKLEEISRELKREKTIEWDRKKEIEATIEKQKKIEKKLEEIEKDLDKTIKKMEESQLLSPQLLEKYQQLQNLFQELMTPELRKSIENLRKSLENLDKKKVDKSLSDFKINQERFLENVERTLELFKKIKVEQKLDRLVQVAEKMMKQQNKITESLDKNTPPSKKSKQELQREADRQQESLEQIDNTLESLDKEPEVWKYPETDDLLKESSKLIDQENMSGEINDLQQNIDQNSKNQAMQNSQKLQGNMKQLHANLKQAQQAMKEKAREEILSKMQRTTDNLLSLSESQEQLMQETNKASNVGDQMRNIASDQKKVSENASKVFQEIIQLSHETFALPPELARSLGKANYNMQKGISDLEQRNKRKAAKAQLDAMAGLNEAAQEMQKSMNGMKSLDSPFGLENFMKQLEQMANGQGQINEQSMNLMPGTDGNKRMPGDQNSRLRQLAAEQRALQEAFDQMHDDYGESKALGRLDNISNEMGEVVKELESLKIDRRTIERQQSILTRMLDAQKSVREKEYSRERKAEVGKEYVRKSPEAGQESIDKKAKKLQVDLLRALQEGYNPDYEILIEEYFRILNQEYLKE